jgi:MFS superfamily sulfate permease-like transporter
MLSKLFPFITWTRNYKRYQLKTDAISGLTVALVLIPQSMAYAELAGLPPYYGLYASFIPPMLAALFGSSRQMATGPVAVVSLMTAASLEPLATLGSEGYIAYAILLALMVGIVQFTLGALRLGLLVNFLSHPVINGFTNAAAIIIASSQLSKIFGVYVDKSEHHYETVFRVLSAAFHYMHRPTLFMCVLAFLIMYLLKRISSKMPSVLVAVVLTTIISWAIGFERNAYVDISAIEHTEVRNLITKFNRAISTIPPLVKKRTEMKDLIESAGPGKDPVAVINAARDADFFSLQIRHLNNEAHIYREKIRSFLLTGVKIKDGLLKFFPADQIPDGFKNDGRIWRIKVGNNPLNNDGLLLSAGGEVVGAIPRGLPGLTIPRIDGDVFLQLLPFAVIISLLGFMEAISIAKAMAAKTGQRIDPNQELIGQGLANIFGAFFKSYPTSGSFSRSAVNLQAGAFSGFSGVFTSITVVVALLVFTPLLHHLPQSVLAAVIMMAVVELVNIKGFFHAWRAQWYDGVISIITFVFTLGFAPHLDKGIMVGVVLSLLVFLYKSMRPTVVDLSLGLDKALHDSVTFGLKECKYIDVVRFDGPLFFANASYLEDQIGKRRISKKELKHIIIASNGINDIDASGEEALSLIVDRVRSAGIDISLSGVNEAVMQVLKRTHLLAKIGEDHIYPKMEAAINAVHELTHRGGHEENCPLRTVVYTHLSY